jgi:pterin-4a-carbinolamine dehydratase
MMRQLPHWRLVTSTVDDYGREGAPGSRTEIVRLYRFRSFLDAVAFMHSASGPIDAFGHHVRWENIFKTVRVALSTWDIGHRPSDRDFKTAIMLDRHYDAFIAGT